MGIEHIVIELGDKVFCDDCGKDYTQSDACGGILFQSKAICPECMPSWVVGAIRYNETHFIKAECPLGKRFSDWVREDLR